MEDNNSETWNRSSYAGNKEFHNPLKPSTNSVDENQNVSKVEKRQNMLTRFYRRRIKSAKERSRAYRPMVESIDEDAETNCLPSTLEARSSKSKMSSAARRTEKRNRSKLKEKSATFDYADLKNEVECPSRINVRRTAICAKSKSADALQLETFIVVTRLKQFDLI